MPHLRPIPAEHPASIADLGARDDVDSCTYHVLNVPLTMVRWFSFFFWASYSVPALWLISFAFLIIELVRRKRPAALFAYAMLPFAGAAIFWIGWQAILVYFGHTKA